RHVKNDKVGREPAHRVDEVRASAEAGDIRKSCAAQRLLKQTRALGIRIDEQDLQRHKRSIALSDIDGQFPGRRDSSGWRTSTAPRAGPRLLTRWPRGWSLTTAPGIPSVPGPVDMTRSASRRRTTGIQHSRRSLRPSSLRRLRTAEIRTRSERESEMLRVVLNAWVTKTTAAEILANPATRRRQAAMAISLNPLRSSPGKPPRFPGRQKPSQFRSVSGARRGQRTENPTVLPRSAPEIGRQSQPAKFRFPDDEMERPKLGLSAFRGRQGGFAARGKERGCRQRERGRLRPVQTRRRCRPSTT